MNNIFIKSVEYTYISNEYAIVNITFDFGVIRGCKFEMYVDDFSKISDANIKKNILRTLDELMERKYIDEI